MIRVPRPEIKAGGIVDKLWETTGAGGDLLYDKSLPEPALTRPLQIPSAIPTFCRPSKTHKRRDRHRLPRMDSCCLVKVWVSTPFPPAYEAGARTSQNSRMDRKCHCG